VAPPFVRNRASMPVAALVSGTPPDGACGRVWPSTRRCVQRGQPLRRPVPQPPPNRLAGAAGSRAPDDWPAGRRLCPACEAVGM